MPVVVDKVVCVSTPGSSVDMLVTQYGITVNPVHKGLAEKMEEMCIRDSLRQDIKRNYRVCGGRCGCPDTHNNMP